MKEFWDKVDINQENECWKWKGSTRGKGYGQVTINCKKRYAHRVSWEIHNETIIPKNNCILHSCDNSLCVNPNHLQLGTHQDNMEDMIEKGRSTYGEKNPNCRLSEKDIIKIREIFGRENPPTRRKVAEKFGVSPQQISRIALKQQWTHI